MGHKKYWLYILPYIFISQTEHLTLLYNTQSGDYYESESIMIKQLISDIHKPSNIGVVEFDDEFLNHKEFHSIINELIKKKIACLVEAHENDIRPVNLLPILNLQNDVEFTGNDNSLPGKNLIKYLSEINLYINNDCTANCRFCDTYFLHTKSCVCNHTSNILNPDIINNILSQAALSVTKNINILGGNILVYPHLKELIQLVNQYDYTFHYWINYQNLMSEKKTINSEQFAIKEILINSSLEDTELQAYISYNINNQNITFHFLFENEKQYDSINEFIYSHPSTNFNLIPIYTKNNLVFFRQNIFMDKDDIFFKPIEQRKIFCHQKLNTTNFGILHILANGDVKANPNMPKIGNINKNTLLEIIYKELKENTVWRKIRDREPCANCIYQFLCPSPSNYEFVLKKNNLCHLKI
jgi:pseudo-rSAM protein